MNKLSVKESSEDLSDSDFEPKHSQRLKPCLQKKRKSKDQEVSAQDVNQAGPSHAGVITVIKEFSSSGNSTPKPHWVLLDSHAEDIACIAGNLNESVSTFKKRYLEHSWEENMLPLAVKELQRYVKRAVHSLCDIADDLRSFNTSSQSEFYQVKAESSTAEVSVLNDEKIRNGQGKVKDEPDTTEYCESMTTDTNTEANPKPDRRTQRCGSTDSDCVGSPELSTNIQRCGSTESIGNASVGSCKTDPCDSDTQVDQTKPKEMANVGADAGGSPNTSCDMFSDTDFLEQPVLRKSECRLADTKVKKSPENIQSHKSLDCKADLLAAESSSDSKSDESEDESSINKAVESEDESSINKAVESEDDSDDQPLKVPVKKSTFNMKDLDVFHTDKKLQERCFVKIVKFSEEDEKKYVESVGSYYDASTSENSDDDNTVKK